MDSTSPMGRVNIISDNIKLKLWENEKPSLRITIIPLINKNNVILSKEYLSRILTIKYNTIHKLYTFMRFSVKEKNNISRIY